MNAVPPPAQGGQHVAGTGARDVTQIQNVTGNVNINTAAAVRSAYLEQVKRIAPELLRDRDAELAELAAFCTEPARGPMYRGGPSHGAASPRCCRGSC